MTKTAQKAMANLYKPIKTRIESWIRNNLEGCENPRLFGRSLINFPNGNWRYRVGKYRIVARISDDKIIIEIVDVDKRNDVYK